MPAGLLKGQKAVRWTPLSDSKACLVGVKYTRDSSRLELAQVTHSETVKCSEAILGVEGGHHKLLAPLKRSRGCEVCHVQLPLEEASWHPVYLKRKLEV